MPPRARCAFGPAVRVAPRHWQGGFPPYGAALRRGGFDCVVLCAAERIPKLPDEQRALVARFPDVEVIFAPMDDATQLDALPPIARAAGQAANLVVDRLRAGRRVLVTCAQGRNRSGLVSALTLIGRYGLSGAEAITAVRQARSNALTNPTFCALLEEIPARRGDVDLITNPQG